MKPFKRYETQIVRQALDDGESIEEMLRRATANNEPIDGNAPMIYTEEKEGVKPEYDIRTDRQELALDATDKFSKSQRAKSDENPQGEDDIDTAEPDKTE